MAKYLFLFLIHINLCFSQKNNKINDLVVLALNKAADTTKIYNIKNILKFSYSEYKNEFEYIPSINPLNPNKLKRFSSKFGKRFHPIDNKVKSHLGLDIAAKKGTPIHAAAKGIVVSVVSSKYGYGNQVIIKHKYGFKTRYAHLHSAYVKKGQVVEKGKIIGFVGNSGKSTGYHLHYEIMKNEMKIDPYPFCFLSI